MVFGYLLERHELAAACVSEQDVDDASCLAHDLVEPVEVGQVGDVAFDADRISTNLARCSIEFSLTPTGNE